MHPSLLISVEKNVFSHVLHKTKLQIFLAFPISQALLRTNLVGNIMTVWCSHHSPNGHYIPDGSGAAVLGINSFRSLADIRKACVCLPALRELRTYDVVFSNDAWRTPPDATALPMASSLITLPTLAKFQLVWRRLCDVLFPSCLVEHTLTAVCVPGLSKIKSKIVVSSKNKFLQKQIQAHNTTEKKRKRKKHT